MKISVAVPVYEYYDRGVEFLDDMFRTIEIQTMQPDEIVISDHSVTDDIENYCKSYDLPIKYKRNPEKSMSTLRVDNLRSRTGTAVSITESGCLVSM